MTGTKADDRYSLGRFNTLPNRCSPATGLTQNTIYGCFIQSVALIRGGYAQYHLLSCHGLTLSQCPYLTITLRQNMGKECLDLLHPTEQPGSATEYLHSSYRV